MITCWYIWKWQNKTIFKENFQRPVNPTSIIQKFTSDIEDCTLNHFQMVLRHTETIYIGWKYPQEGWIKLNCDGACKENGDRSGCGGLLRDANGRWIKGFVRKIGACDALHAKMWGIYLGLELAWRDGISQLCVESDSKLLVDMITNNCKMNGTTLVLIRRIQNILNRNWKIQVHHTLREGNRSVDWLANFSLTMDSWNLILLETPSTELNSLLFDDIFGACMPRNVRLIM